MFQQVHITRFSHASALLKTLQCDVTATPLAARKAHRLMICTPAAGRHFKVVEACSLACCALKSRLDRPPVRLCISVTYN